MILNVDASYSTETGVGAWAVHQRIRRGKTWRLLASEAEHCANSGDAEERAVRLALACLAKTEAEAPHLVRCDCEPVVRRMNRAGMPEGVTLSVVPRAELLHPHQVSRAVRSAYERGVETGELLTREEE